MYENKDMNDKAFGKGFVHNLERVRTRPFSHASLRFWATKSIQIKVPAPPDSPSNPSPQTGLSIEQPVR